MIAVIVAVASAWALGILCVSALWPRHRLVSKDWNIIFPLGIGVGFGVTSGFFFFASLLFDRPLFLSTALDLLCLAGVSWHLRGRGLLSSVSLKGMRWECSWLTVLAGSILVQASVVAIALTARAYAAEPYGSWDAWAIWNMHARFLFRAKAHWPILAHQAQVAWTHSDYPLLVPASVARAWSFAGGESTFAAGLISTLFGVATVWLLIGAVQRLRNGFMAAVGGLILLGTPAFVTFSSNEHADIPLGFFILSTAVVIALSKSSRDERGLSLLAGICAGQAAWTKNEGVLFVVIATFIWLLWSAKEGSTRPNIFFIIGLLLALVPEVYFKVILAPANDIASGSIFQRLGNLTDWSRHRLILKSCARDLLRFGEWKTTPFLVMALPLLVQGKPRLALREWEIVGIVTLMLAGYYTVYLLTPWDLAWHLDTSLVRLLLQLWPCAVLLWSLAVMPDGVYFNRFSSAVILSRKMLIVFAILNLGAFGGILALLSSQLAANELAVKHVWGATARVTLGEGWYGTERNHRDRWAWSEGKSSLLVHLDAKKPTRLTLKFAMRSLGDRQVTATLQNQVVWRASVHEKLAWVDTLSSIFSPGTTEIIFATNTPAMPEAPAKDARPLTFSIYNLQVESSSP